MDKKILEVCIPLLLLLFVGRAFAVEGNQPIVNINLDSVTNAIDSMFSGLNQSLGGLSQSLAELPAAVVEQFFSVFQGILAVFLTSLLAITKLFIVTNPDISPMFPLWQTIVYVISLFYLMLFLIVGFLFLFSSIDAEKRLQAKQWFKSTVIMIAAVGASFQLYELFLGLGSAVANYLWSTEFEALFQANGLPTLNLVLLMFYSLAVLSAFITFFVRHLFLLIGAAVFPIALFFYFIPPLKAWGKMLLEILFAGVLMQIIDVIIFIGAETVWQQFAGIPDFFGWAPATAFALVAGINVLIMWFAVIKATRTISSELPELVVVARTAGQLAAGALL